MLGDFQLEAVLPLRAQRVEAQGQHITDNKNGAGFKKRISGKLRNGDRPGARGLRARMPVTLLLMPGPMLI